MMPQIVPPAPLCPFPSEMCKFPLKHTSKGGVGHSPWNTWISLDVEPCLSQWQTLIALWEHFYFQMQTKSSWAVMKWSNGLYSFALSPEAYLWFVARSFSQAGSPQAARCRHIRLAVPCSHQQPERNTEHVTEWSVTTEQENITCKSNQARGSERTTWSTYTIRVLYILNRS